MTWDYEILQAHFNERDMKCILAIPLSARFPNDVLMWACSKNGLYNVKTAYMLGKGCNLDDFHQGWVEIWKTNVIPKARNFLWRLCTNTLPVRSLLKYRHLTEIDLCPWCDCEPESWQHALFNCWRVQELWFKLNCEEMKKDVGSLSPCDLIKSWKDLENGVRIRGIYLMWGLWQDRNMKVFQGKDDPIELLVARVLRWTEESTNIAETTKRDAVAASICPSPKKWFPPPSGTIKINADASVTEEGWVGLGVVARDDKGEVLFAATRRVRAWWSVKIAEAKAMVWAINLGSRYGYNSVIIESDCQVVVSRLAKGVTYSTELDAILGDAMVQSTCFGTLQWSHVRREGNVVARNLAKLIPSVFEKIWDRAVPPNVSPYVLMDALAINL